MRYIVIVGRKRPTHKRKMRRKSYPILLRPRTIHSEYTWVDMTPRRWRESPRPVAIHRPMTGFDGKAFREEWKRIWKGLQEGFEGFIRLMQRGWAGIERTKDEERRKKVEG